MKRILTLTMNPAIDASCSVASGFPDHKLRCGPVLHEPGDGGINVLRAIQNLGGQSTVFYVAGGPSGQMLGVLLDREGLKHLAIPIGDWTRENFTITEGASGQQYRFVVPGPSVRTKEWNGCLEEIAEIDPIPEFIVASGSLPPNVSPDFYAWLAKKIHDKGSRFVSRRRLRRCGIHCALAAFISSNRACVNCANPLDRNCFTKANKRTPLFK